jgi:hypothetical protein
MHFFYLDESGDTGLDFTNVQQPIFVMGGVSLSDEKWNKTQQSYNAIIEKYFDGLVPNGFELHAHELLSPDGQGPFAGHPRAKRNQLGTDLLNAIVNHNHHIHAIAFDKKSMSSNECNIDLAFNPRVPYLIGFDYLITQINDHIKFKLGRSARGLIILDKKEIYHRDIENILHNRRFQTVASHRVKWIVEFSYPIDSHKNPMIQLSDLVVFCIRKFLEVEHGHRTNWNQEAKSFFATCYKIIESRLTTKTLIDRTEPKLKILNDHLNAIRLKPGLKWRKKYDLT